MDPHVAAVAIEQWGANLPENVLVPALKEHVPAIKQLVQQALAATTLARALSTQRAAKATLGGVRSRAARQAVSRQVYSAVYTREEFSGKPTLLVRLWGLAQMLEEGGRTERHMIPFDTERYAIGARLRSRQQRTSPVRAMGTVTLKGARFAHPITLARGQGIQHPGSRVRAHGLGARVMRDALESARATRLAWAH